MSTPIATQTTLDDLPRKKPFKESQSPKSKTTPEPIEEVDYSTTDFTEHLKEDIIAARKRKGKEGSVDVQDKETEKFLKKAKISFLGQNIHNEHKTRRQISKKESVFYNNTGKDVQYTFCKTAQDTTTAQLTTSRGFKIGVLAFLGGGLGGQGGLGVGAQYSRGTESMQQSSNASGREMHAQVTVPVGSCARVFETNYSAVTDAKCDFDIAIKNSHEIKYTVKGGKHTQITAADLDPYDTITTEKHLVKPDKTIEVVHLHRSCKCTLVSIEHDIEMKLENFKGASESEETSKGSDTPDT